MFPIIDIINTDIVERILQSFYDIFKIPSIIYDDNINKISKEIGNCSFCDLIHCNSNARSACLSSEIKNLKNNTEIKIYRCDHGLTSFTLPIKANGKVFAHLAAGKIVTGSDNLNDVQKRLSALKRSYGFSRIEYKKITKELQNIPVISQTELTKPIEFLQNIVEIVVQLIYKNKNIEKLQLSNRISKLISEERNINKVIENIFRLLKQNIDFDTAIIFKWNPSEKKLAPYKYFGYDSNFIEKQGFKFNVSQGYSGKVFYDNEALLIPDVDENDLKPMYPNIKHNVKLKSYLGTPVTYHHKRLGVFAIISSKKKSFDLYDESLLSSISDQIGIAIENFSQFDYFSKSHLEENKFSLLKNEIENFTSLNSLLQSCVDNLAIIFNAQVCTIYKYNNLNKSLVLTAAVGFPDHLINNAKYNLGEGITGSVANQNEPLYIDNVYDCPDHIKRKGKYSTWIPEEEGIDYISFLGTSLRLNEKLYGIITITKIRESADDGNEFNENDKKLIVNISNTIIDIVKEFERINLPRTVINLINSIKGSNNLEIILTGISWIIPEILDYNACIIRLRENNYLKVRAQTGLKTNYIKDKYFIKIGEGVSGKTAKTGKIQQVINGSHEKEFQFEDFLKNEGLKSLISLPLISKNEVYGVINLYKKSSIEITKQEITILEKITSYCDSFIPDILKYTSLRKENDQYTSIVRVMNTVSSKLDLKYKTSQSLKETLDFFNTDSGFIIIVNPITKKLLHYKIKNLKVLPLRDWDERELVNLIIRKCKVINRNEKYLLNDINNNNHDYNKYFSDKISSIIASPILYSGKNYGVIGLTSTFKHKFHNSAQTLELLANFLAVSIQNSLNSEELIKVVKENTEIQMQQKFSRGVAHAIVNIQASIPDSINSLKYHINEKEYISHVDLIESAVSRIYNINANFLTVYKTKFNLNYEKLVLHEIVEEHLEGFEFEFNTNNISIKNEIEKDLEFSANENMIKLIISNLLYNSIDSFKKSQSNKEITLRGVKNREIISFSISDNGKGINQLILNKLKNGEMIDKANGFGIGIPSIRTYVKYHKGSLEINSKIDKGTTVTIHLKTYLNN